jgi:hypothetical protein
MGTLLVERRKYRLEICRSSNLPRLHGQPQRAHRGWENLFNLTLTTGDPLVQNRDMEELRNGFFE